MQHLAPFKAFHPSHSTTTPLRTNHNNNDALCDSLEGAAVADVVAHAAAEQARLLVDNPQLAAVPLSIQLCQVIAINQHLAICVC